MADIDMKDLSISNYNIGSAWKPDWSGICVRHIPTGVEARVSSERSEHKNRAAAIKMINQMILIPLSLDAHDCRKSSVPFNSGQTVYGGRREYTQHKCLLCGAIS